MSQRTTEPYRRLELWNQCAHCERDTDHMIILLYAGEAIVLHVGCERAYREQRALRVTSLRRLVADLGGTQLPLPVLGAEPYEVAG